MLARLLEKRFGSLDAETRGLVEAADAATLLAWADRVLTARSLAEVFARP